MDTVTVSDDFLNIDTIGRGLTLNCNQNSYHILPHRRTHTPLWVWETYWTYQGHGEFQKRNYESHAIIVTIINELTTKSPSLPYTCIRLKHTPADGRTRHVRV